jgi:thiamine transport system permease protein
MRFIGVIPAAFLLAFLLLPMGRLVLEAGPLSLAATALELWAQPYLQWRLVWTLVQAAAACLATLVIGAPIAWILARFEFPGRTLVLRVMMLPFVVPTLVAALGILALFGRSGQGTPWLLLYGNVFFNLCLVVRAGVTGFEQVSATAYGAARTLGATPWRAFWRLEWPAVLPWLASSACLVFLYCLAGLSLPLILGGQEFATIEVEIYTLVAHELKLLEASVLALCMLCLTFALALTYTRLERQLATPHHTDKITRRPPTLAKQMVAVGAAIVALLVICVAPLLAILAQLSGHGASITQILFEPETLRAIWNTLRFSAMALLLATLLGIAHALAAQGSNWLRSAAYLPFIVSPCTVAFGLLLLYPSFTASLPLLIAAYAMLAYPFIANALATALDAIPPNLLHAARTLGASPWRLFWRVTLPILRPSLRRGMAFAAATSMGEFAVSLFLSRPEWTTLTTLIYQRLSTPGSANFNDALTLAVVLMLLALGAFITIEGREPVRA